MKMNVLTVFPEMFNALTDYGIIGQAFRSKKVSIECINPRDFTTDFHKTVDDRPYGGGDGMVFLAEPLAKAMNYLKEKNSLGHVIYMSPQGSTFNQKKAQEIADILSSGKTITFISGRYGGIDQRFIETYVDEEISLGDFIISGGELAAMTVIDSALRLVSGVLGNISSSLEESFSLDYLEAPLFTRPREFAGLKVPEVLLSGHHENIQEFKKSVGILRTLLLRPDLIAKLNKASLGEAFEQMAKLTEPELLACGLSREKLKEIHDVIEARTC